MGQVFFAAPVTPSPGTAGLCQHCVRGDLRPCRAERLPQAGPAFGSFYTAFEAHPMGKNSVMDGAFPAARASEGLWFPEIKAQPPPLGNLTLRRVV